MKKNVYLIVSKDLYRFVEMPEPMEARNVEGTDGAGYVVATPLTLGQIRQIIGTESRCAIVAIEDPDVFFTNNDVLRQWVNEKLRHTVIATPANTAPTVQDPLATRRMDD